MNSFLNKFHFHAAALLLLALSACAKNNQENVAYGPAGVAASPKALPKTWVQLPESTSSGTSTSTTTSTSTNADSTPATTAEEPSPEAAQNVIATLKAHTDALSDALAPTDAFASLQSASASANHPKDWAPWHLDGMIADFAFTTDGFFGALLGEGQTALKVTWQKQKEADTDKKKEKAKKATVQVTSKTTPAELSSQLEPTVRAAVAAGSVKNEAALRGNLARQTLRFLSLSRVLSRLKPYKGWSVDGYQLQLTFDGSGQVTPVVAVGGTLTIVLNWSRPEDGENDGPSLPLNVADARMLDGAKGLMQSIAPAVSQSTPETQDLKKKGFILDELHVGLGISAGGDIGIAAVDALAFGKLIFKKEEAPAAGPLSDAEFTATDTDINMIGGDTGFLQNASTASNQENQVFKVSQQKFGKGLAHALHMAGFFAKRAHEVTSPA